MDKYKVLSVTEKTAKTGRPYKACELEAVSGDTYKVNIFSSAPDFANIKGGSYIMGKLSQEGQYWNFTFPEQQKQGGGGAYKQAVIEKTMERKEASISKFADNKEHAIKLASTIRMAVDIALSETPEQQETTLQETIRKWRKWLWEEWELDPRSVDPFN